MQPMRIVFQHIDVPDIDRLEVYERHGGYQALRKALEMEPQAIIEEVKTSSLRGRGGAGFPTGRKWDFIPKEPGEKYLAVNADESEPGTFKDRELMLRNPHELLEGAAICCRAIGAARAFIYIRGEFTEPAAVISRAIGEAYDRGYLGKNILGSDFNLDITVYRGAGAYICGEETAMLSSLEGERGFPRLRPPFPAARGLYARPTVINNVETLCNVPHIIRNGGAWFASIGTPKSTGTKVFSVSGHVNRPGNYELPMGVSARELLMEHAGGILGGKKLKAWIPGGTSVPMLTDEHLDVRMDFESLLEAGSMLGSAGVIVMNEEVCIVRAAANIARFYQHESCGKCTPCREGTGWLTDILTSIEAGSGRPGDVEKLRDIASNMLGRCFCALGDAATMPVLSSTEHFREEYEDHIRLGRCPMMSN